MKVAVLMGGPSEEHAISLKSGQGIVEALRQRQWDVESAVIPKTSTVDEAGAVVRQVLGALHPDATFIALHGAFGEDGSVQQLCDELHLAYTGSDALASRLGMDKVASRKRFEAAGLAVPAWQLIDATSAHQIDWACASYPMVIKPVNQGSSLGVSIVRDPAEAPRALSMAAQFGPRVLIETFIPGREMTVGVLGDEALPVVEIRPKHPFFDYAAKYTVGETDYVVPAPLPPAVASAVQAAGLFAHRALGCRHFSRTDLILTPEGRPVVLEVNTIPGFTPTSLLPKAAACAGISYGELCEQLVMMAWQGSPHLARS
jgi:D-alanine-D-alanine ligase